MGRDSGTLSSTAEAVEAQGRRSAVIELDGASEGMGILHMLAEVDPDNVFLGMAVEAVWKPEVERRGAITDILYFRPSSPSATEVDVNGDPTPDDLMDVDNQWLVNFARGELWIPYLEPFGD
ncbi:MAG: hypothetical protein IH820_11380, partial [Bacteroidetes bacterium]|nr:hypothetical protein [Bacteroidota bacterium]